MSKNAFSTIDFLIFSFYYVSSRWPGRVSDQRVWRNSNLFGRLEAGWRPRWAAANTVLLGDSGYTNTDYLVTPILLPQSPQEIRYNRAHRQTRRLIECAIGVLKNRFRCLLHAQHLAPEFVGEIIRCCVALHNLLLDPDEAAMFLEEDDWRPDANLQDSDGGNTTDDDEEELEEGAGRRRRQLVRTF